MLHALLLARPGFSGRGCGAFLGGLHTLSLGGDQVAEQVSAMSLTGTAVHDGRNMADVLMFALRLVLLERQNLVKLSWVGNLLQLPLIALHLLLEILNSLRDRLSNLQVVLHALHGCSRLGLLDGILSERLVRVHELLDLLLLEVDLSHLAMVVCQLLIIVIVSRLRVLLDLVDRSLGLIVCLDSGGLASTLCLLNKLSRSLSWDGLGCRLNR